MTRKSQTLAASTLAYLALVAGLSAPSFIPQSPEDRQPRREGAEWEIIRTLSPLPKVPPDTTNAFADDPRAARLGQILFFEKDIAGPIITPKKGNNGGLGKKGETHQISCASCHQPDSGWMFDLRSNTGVPQNPHATALGAHRPEVSIGIDRIKPFARRRGDEITG